MGSRKVFFDEDGNEMECYVNDKGKVYIGVSNDDVMSNAYITLKKGEIKELIAVLKQLEEGVH